jgi:carboxypeptidase Taq
MTETFERLRTRLAEIQDLRRAAAVLSWDQQTMMPLQGAAGRAEQLATIGRMAHELFVADETAKLLEELRGFEESHDPQSFEASLVRVTRTDYEKAVRVSPELRAEMSRAASQGFLEWKRAKEASDFAAFVPTLERNLELKQRYLACFDKGEEDYDVLLDDFERGMRTSEVRRIFDDLKAELVPLIAAAEGRNGEAALEGEFDPDVQRELSHEVIELFGFREGAWRLDPTMHPFASGGGINDIRITTHYESGELESLFATMHEYGHGLYEHQVDPALERTPLGSGVSLGLHESQSRMWENLVGRGRPFWRFFYPRVQALFPDELGSMEVESFYAAVNSVKPSLIRIHADEVTYNMHVILRFELEQDLIGGAVDIRSLPEEWNRRMDAYLGIEVPDDAHGVLQDVHWSGGAIGYFPTYTLGNVMSLQIWERLREDIGDLDERIERGDFAALREWLGERLHRHGRKFTPAETLEKIVGGPIETGPYLRYLKEKHGVPAA